MALVTEVGSFTLNTTLGTQPVSLSNFTGLTPKAVMFWWTHLTGDDVKQGWGLATGPTEEACVSICNEDNQGNSDNVWRSDNTKCIQSVDPANTVITAAEFTSFAANQFTVNVTTNSEAIVVNYLVLGGADLTDAKLHSWLDSTSNGDQVVTGVGFQPDAAISISANNGTALASSGNATAAGIHFWDGTNERSHGGYAKNNQSTTDTNHSSKSQALWCQNPAVTTNMTDATFVSFDSDGFTINQGTAGVLTTPFHTLCLKGGTYEVGSDQTPASAPNTITSTTSITPHTVLYHSVGTSTADPISNAAHLQLSTGASDGTNDCAAVIQNQDNQSTVSNVNHSNNQATSLRVMNTSGTVQDIATTSFSGADVDTVFSAADSTQRYFSFFAIGDDAATTSEFPFKRYYGTI